jgi:hypothetical protein
MNNYLPCDLIKMFEDAKREANIPELIEALEVVRLDLKQMAEEFKNCEHRIKI